MDTARRALGAFATGRTAYVAGALPQDVLRLPTRAVFDALHGRLGGVLAQALDPAHQVPSPRRARRDGAWLKSSHVVGLNLRCTGDLLGGLKYVLTLPPHVDAVHLLPVFEPGVVGSLYGMASWRINAEFFSHEWARFTPAQRHVNDQLRAFVNLCHALGKTVGIDVIPHVDRFSEIALCNPWAFEWVRRDDTRLVDHRAGLSAEVQELIVGWRFGRSNTEFAHRFFAQHEAAVAYELFGSGDVHARNARRDDLIQFLYDFGYETLPATMAPPYRGLEVDPRPEALTVDHRGRRWRDYRFTDPGPMSRVFGPLTRYRLWEARDDNRDWALDHDRPRMPVWDYVAAHYREVVGQYGFDFMRGDMSHVQTRPEGVPADPAPPYDILRYTKEACAKTYPHFAYFAESFLTADDYMTYGSEAAHLEASDADVALGNLQEYAPHDPTFHRLLAEYVGLAEGQTFRPAFTLFSADKDDPRFDDHFVRGNVARYFFAAFYPGLPSYSSLGFRARAPRVAPVANERYSKYYVFHYDEGPKATRGPYVFDRDTDLYAACARIDGFRQNMSRDYADAPGDFVLGPDVTAERRHVVWRAGGYLFAVNFGAAPAAVDLDARGRISDTPVDEGAERLEAVFTVPARGYDARTRILQPDAGVVFFDPGAEVA